MNNSFCESEDAKIEVYGQINEVYQNNTGENLICLLSAFRLSDLRDFLYSSCSEQYAYSLIEKIETRKLLNVIF